MMEEKLPKEYKIKLEDYRFVYDEMCKIIEETFKRKLDLTIVLGQIEILKARVLKAYLEHGGHTRIEDDTKEFLRSVG